ncbi:MAG: CBS domain-containing protein [Zetaproteobacteria bacterium]|nr:CBS domain-containing protein [Zetaproteobacteria bacterium]
MSIKERLRAWLLRKLQPGKTENELIDLLAKSQSVHSDEQRRMLTKVIDFHDTRVRELMVSRSSVKYIDIHLSLAEAETEMRKHGVSRLLVVDGSLDQVQGVIRVWDLFEARSQTPEPKLADLIHPCLQVSELQQVSGILSEMREASHMAVVLDEYGGVAGIVTLSDLLEEIVGRLDETGSEGDGMIQRTVSGVEVQARIHVEDLAEALGVPIPKGDFETLGGLIISDLGRIPLRGERMMVAGMDMHIQEADPRRIIRVLIRNVPNLTLRR